MAHRQRLTLLAASLLIAFCKCKAEDDIKEENFKDLECTSNVGPGLCWPKDDCNAIDSSNSDSCNGEDMTNAVCCPIEDAPTNPDVDDRSIAGPPSVRRFVSSHRPRNTFWTNRRLPTRRTAIWRPTIRPTVPLRPLPVVPTRGPIRRPVGVADRIIPVSECAAIPVTGETIIQPLITNGVPALVSEYPFIGAFMGKDSDDIFCGGSLISREWVLTAAHCVERRKAEEFYIRFRDQDLTSNADNVLPVRAEPARIIMHPSWSRSAVYNDIALIKLSRPVRETDIKPVCLADASLPDVTNAEATVLGYGSDGLRKDSLRTLMKADIKIAPADDCKEAYGGSTRLPQGITRNLICAGDVVKGKDACRGDSGGPLVVNHSNKWHLVGVVAAGRDCGKFHGLYTRVSLFYDWIISNTRN